ncbi:MAG: O-antigen ligase family protein [Thermoleophilia bacterium]|nr:O-antigen ligase family protein [Thermoleophilia bacterium]
MDSASPELLASVAAIAASIGALARTTRVRRIHFAGVPLLLAGWLGLAWSVLPNSLQDHAAAAAAALVVALLVGWLAARLLAGRESWLLAAGAALLTIRIPVPTGDDDSAMLLVPFYLVIALGALIVIRRELVDLRAAPRRPLADRGGATRLLDVGAALLPAVATLSLTWSWVPEETTKALAFYLVPFVLAYQVVRSLLDARIDARAAGWALVASSTVLALVGLYQWLAKDVWWNPKVIDANRFRPDFRTNSLLWDPNMFGRALVVAIVAVVAWLLVARLRARGTAALVAVLALLVAALWTTYSQSSWVALAAALVLLALLTTPPAPRRWLAALVAVVVVVGTPLAASALSGSDEDGRQHVVRTGISLAAERPVLGWGIGTFDAAARARELEQGNRDPRLTASHTTPITVFAELGLLGAFTYLTLLASAGVAILARWRRTSTRASHARASGSDERATGWPIAPIIWATGTIMALFAHSLLYAGFFEDPTTWVALAVLASLPMVRPSDDDTELHAELSSPAPERTEGVTAHTGDALSCSSA